MIKMLYVVKLDKKKYVIELYDDNAIITEETSLYDTPAKLEKEQYEVEDIDDIFLDMEDEQSSNVKATMPGTVVSVEVKSGDMVKAGEVLLVYESMKMENEVLSPVSGKIQTINVEKGDKIKRDQILITFLENKE